MRAVIQVVKKAKLIANGQEYSNIEKGFVVLLGITNTDTEKDAEYIANKIAKLRVFEDENGKLNLALNNVNGSVLLVSNFTLYGSTKGTNRPDFINAAKPEISKPLYEKCVQILSTQVPTKTGVFGADMLIEMMADGPCTIIIDTEKN
ncbi:MAG: D-tyrosyl-tRNA(Tyr) deacylase [Clostridiales bacterium]|nr:D-tyrosyl-tRNA(Tyr) deacylase [Clostridiales bacterium]